MPSYPVGTSIHGIIASDLTSVVRVDFAIWQAQLWQSDLASLLEDINKSIRPGALGFAAWFTGIHPPLDKAWSVLNFDWAIAIATVAIGYGWPGSDPAHHDRPRGVYTKSYLDSEPVFFELPLEPCPPRRIRSVRLGQSKDRKWGTWKSKTGEKDRRRLRWPLQSQ